MTRKLDLITHFDSVAEDSYKRAKRGSYLHKEFRKYLAFLIPPDSSVLHIGSGTGDLLASLKPTKGLGIDYSSKMVEVARQKHPNLEFQVGDLDNLDIKMKYDYVLLVNVIGYADDIQNAFGQLKKVCRNDTRVIVVYFNYLWEPILKVAEKIGIRMTRPTQHWLPPEDIENIFNLCNFEVVRRTYRFLVPVYVPIVSMIFNKIIANLPGIRRLCLNHVVIARFLEPKEMSEEVSCSIIIPCRNEKGNIEQAVKRVPKMGRYNELIFVEGHSTDGTLEECYRVQKTYPEKDIKVLIQDGKGKGNAMLKGFASACGDIFMILDADLTVPPEDLIKFFKAISSGKGEFINGSRLVYKMETQAMRSLNFAANKLFGIAFSYLLDQKIRDTLCGTKVLWKKDYEKIAANREYFGDFDPFEDFDLLFGAARLNLLIVEIPVKYGARTYGTTSISRFKDGWLLIKMMIYAARKIKCS